jgi:hypothetical protein
MQAESYESASVRLSTEHKGRKRRAPVWIARYRVAGKDSAKVLGQAWTKRSRPPAGFLTRADAEAKLRRFLEAEGAKLSAAGGASFGRVADAYLAWLERRIETGDFRATTLRSYRNIINHELKPAWVERPVGSIDRDEVSSYRRRLVERGLSASTINQQRAIVRGIFQLAVREFGLGESPAAGFQWTRTRRATSGAINFYRPDEVLLLAQHAATSRTRRSSSPPPSPACARASFATSAGAPLTLPTRLSTSSAATPTRAASSCLSPTRSARSL